MCGNPEKIKTSPKIDGTTKKTQKSPLILKDFFERKIVDCQSALKSIHLTASNNVQQESKVMPFLAPFYAA
jgi:hypothetical protein